MSQKVHHLHIRKTGGRSVHTAVLGRTGFDTGEVYSFLTKHPGSVAEVGAFKIGAWVSDLGRPFDYGFSHNPFYNLINVSDEVFIICCLRDPVQRFLSQWKMIKNYIDKRALRAKPHMSLEDEVQYFDLDYVRYFEKLPRFHSMNQLYMFSESGNLTEAVIRLKRMNLILETENLSDGIKRLFKIHGWTLDKVPHVGAASVKADISPAEEAQLRRLMYEEYALLDVARTLNTHYTRG